MMVESTGDKGLTVTLMPASRACFGVAFKVYEIPKILMPPHYVSSSYGEAYTAGAAYVTLRSPSVYLTPDWVDETRVALAFGPEVTISPELFGMFTGRSIVFNGMSVLGSRVRPWSALGRVRHMGMSAVPMRFSVDQLKEVTREPLWGPVDVTLYYPCPVHRGSCVEESEKKKWARAYRGVTKMTTLSIPGWEKRSSMMRRTLYPQHR